MKLKKLSEEKLGKPSSKPPKLIGQFEDYTHYGEIKDLEKSKKIYYLKQKQGDKTIYAVETSKTELNDLRHILTIYQQMESNYPSIILSYKGSKNNIPCMDKINRKNATFLTFETFDYDLELELKLRIIKNRSYGESELWGFALAVSLFMNSCYERDISHCNLNLKTIFSKQNKIKITQPRFFKFEKTNFFYCKKKEKCYYSKEMIHLVRNKSRENELNAEMEKNILEKNDVFSLGLLLLELSCLDIEDKWYDVYKNDMNWGKVKKKLSKLKQKYSAEFYSVVREMVLMKQEKRPDFFNLCKLIWIQMKGKKVSRVEMNTLVLPESIRS